MQRSHRAFTVLGIDTLFSFNTIYDSYSASIYIIKWLAISYISVFRIDLFILYFLSVLFFRKDMYISVHTPFHSPQVSVCIPVLRLSRLRKKVLFYCHFPDQLLTQRKSALKKLYRAPIDWLEERTTGMADMVRNS